MSVPGLTSIEKNAYHTIFMLNLKTVLKIINEHLWSTNLFSSFMVIERNVVEHWFVVLDVTKLEKF